MKGRENGGLQMVLKLTGSPLLCHSEKEKAWCGDGGCWGEAYKEGTLGKILARDCLRGRAVHSFLPLGQQKGHWRDVGDPASCSSWLLTSTDTGTEFCKSNPRVRQVWVKS